MARDNEEAEIATSTERTPLLRDQSSQPNGHTTQSTTQSDQEHGTPPEPNEEPTVLQEASTKKLLLIMSSTFIGVFFAALDTTVVATLTASISSSFNSLSLLSWLATGYLIANAACQPLSGKLTDIFSRRRGLLFSNFFFAVGTLICGFAPNAPTMIAGRVIAGIGGGGLTCIATFITSDLVPLRRRGIWQGVGNLVFGSGMAMGGLFGGLCADHLNWRWAFFLQVPFIAVGTILVYILIDIPVNPSKKRPLSRIDFLGSGLLVTSLVLLLVGLNTGGNQLPWNHPLVIGALVASGVILVIFIYVESSPNIVPEPVIPVSLVAHTRTVLAACFANWFSTMVVFSALYYVPLYLQVVQHTSSTAAGLRNIPQSVALSIGSLGVGYVMRLTGRYYYLNIAVMAMLVLGQALLVTLDVTSPHWLTYVYVAPVGLGYGAMLTITLVAMISAVDHKYHSVITAASYAFRSTGSTIGITIASAVFQNVLTNELTDTYGDMPDADKIIRSIRDSLEGVKHLPPGWDEKIIQAIYMDAFRAAFGAGLGLAVVATLCGLFMREHTLHMNLSRK